MSEAHAADVRRTRLHPRDELLTMLESAGVPAGPINTVADAFADPQIVARALEQSFVPPDGQTIAGVRPPLRLNTLAPEHGGRGPALGPEPRG